MIFGNGKQSRDFVYIDDVVEALVKAATIQNIDRSIINIGSGVDVTMNQLVDDIERLAGIAGASFV